MGETDRINTEGAEKPWSGQNAPIILIPQHYGKIVPCAFHSGWTSLGKAGLSFKRMGGIPFSLNLEGQDWQSILVQVCLRAPRVVADEAKLAIVFTDKAGHEIKKLSDI